jgi:hypothetical protein
MYYVYIFGERQRTHPLISFEQQMSESVMTQFQKEVKFIVSAKCYDEDVDAFGIEMKKPNKKVRMTKVKDEVYETPSPSSNVNPDEDISSGLGSSSDISSDVGTSSDMYGGQGSSSDMYGGQGSSSDISSGLGSSSDISIGVRSSSDSVR